VTAVLEKLHKIYPLFSSKYMKRLLVRFETTVQKVYRRFLQPLKIIMANGVTNNR